MIPKIIHYCWFGRKPKPKSVLKFMRTWKKHLPDYQLMEWNEDNFDISSVPFVSEAYRLRKYAFVSDYVRLFALYHHGGIYFDTDVEVLKSFDDLLDAPGFMGYDSDKCLGTAVMAANKGNEVINEFMGLYHQMAFSTDGLLPNTKLISHYLETQGVILNNQFFIFRNQLFLYPLEFFIVQTYDEFKLHLTSNSYSIHHYAASWFPWIGRMRVRFLKSIGPKGVHIYKKIARLVKG